MRSLDIAVIVLYLAGMAHLLLFGFLGMVACLVVAPVASVLKGKKNDD